MSTSKTNHPGDAAAKHLSFTPAQHEEASANALPTGQVAGDNAKSQSGQRQDQGQASQQPTGTTQNQNAKGSAENSAKGGLEAQAKSWLNQQQWLQNIDVNQLSKQAKGLGSKAVEQVNRLTPTQKVVGGALLVSGLSWLALRSKSNKSASSYGGTSFGHDEDETWQRSSESVYRGRSTNKKEA